MTNYKQLIVVKDDNKFCVCGQGLVADNCPKCDPISTTLRLEITTSD